MLHSRLASGLAEPDLWLHLWIPCLLLTPCCLLLHLWAILSSLKKILLTGAFLLVILEIINKFYREVTSIMRKKQGVGQDPS